MVYNPTKAPLQRLRTAVAEHERRRGWRPTRWYETAGDDAGRAAARRAADGDPEVVIVAGGDGTVRAVADVLRETGMPIALVPSGTGNLLARFLGTPLNDVSASVSAAFTGVDRAVDVGVAEIEDEEGVRRTHVFMVMAGIGLDAQMAHDTSAIAKKHLGWLAYVTPIARSIIANRLFHLVYRVDGGRTRSTRAHTVIVGNCGTLTGNMLLIPAAVIDDGLLDVVLMRPAGPFGWAKIGTRFTLQSAARRSRITRRWLSRSPDLHSLAYVQGRRFDARFDTPHAVELDGDPFGHIVRARISVRPGALRIRGAAT
ncbi:diacylglycerol/lipid kinase family protein [Microbacterium hominis]|uniref:NAD(+)/NADH kinase n=1 Tax=Microbacterium hominis TaxID=162426 RepID=A0A7D4Q7B1_9MICO|nr:diacylglycerol kinase family protein [Microbacterium hominis]QKJ18859.1 NAD(+)/NADH kinase [Microbacterium hominis]